MSELNTPAIVGARAELAALEANLRQIKDDAMKTLNDTVRPHFNEVDASKRRLEALLLAANDDLLKMGDVVAWSERQVSTYHPFDVKTISKRGRVTHVKVFNDGSATYSVLIIKKDGTEGKQTVGVWVDKEGKVSRGASYAFQDFSKEAQA